MSLCGVQKVYFIIKFDFISYIKQNRSTVEYLNGYLTFHDGIKIN